MRELLFALTFFLGFTCGLPLIILLILGYRERVRKVTEAANRNAGYWAEAEAKLAVVQLENVQLDIGYRAEIKRADELSRIAREALRVAHGREFTSSSQDLTDRTIDCTKSPLTIDDWPEEIN